MNAGTLYDGIEATYRHILKDVLAVAAFEPLRTGGYVFRYEKASIALVLDKEDPEFVRLLHMVVHSFKRSDPVALRNAELCAGAVIRKLKLVKIFVQPETNTEDQSFVTAAVEFLVEDVKTITVTSLERCLNALKTAQRDFHEYLDEIESAEGDKPASLPALASTALN